ncbi:MAG TPA: hypothetical protein VMR25_13525 [Planctomycetaceae bacterium]|jgi:hypothetical protein|nr:hypothetical protein [Planctomycetaceae bacterium]
MKPRTFGPRRIRLAALPVAVILAGVLSASGCTYVVLLGYLIGGPPSIKPDFDKLTKESLTDKGVKVAVVCFAPDEIRLNFIDVDKDIANYVAHRLIQNKIQVVHPDRVQEWLDKHDDWDKPDEVGEATGATHVIFVDVHKYNLFEENSHELFRGKAEVLVSVFKMQKGDQAEKIYTKEITSLYPLTAPRATSEISYDRFRRQYLGRLSDEVGRLFYEYFNGDDIADVI